VTGDTEDAVTVADLADRLDGSVATAQDVVDRQVRGGYVSDLLSDVIAHAHEGDAWVTLQRHVNIVAVAQLKGLAVVVLVNGRQPEADTVARAVEERIPIVSTPLDAFEAVGILHEAGVRGRGAS
jgi:predicted transcriptional regulator